MRLLPDKPINWSFIAGLLLVMSIDYLVVWKWFQMPAYMATWESLFVAWLSCATLAIRYNLKYYRPQKQKFLYVKFVAGVLTVLFCCAYAMLMNKLYPEASSYLTWLNYSLPVRMVIGWLVITNAGNRSLLWYDLQAQRELEARRKVLEDLSRDAELFKLRQQLQPHFLFNSLNSINALIALRPQEARQMVLKLSDFFRGSLKREDEKWIPLPDELQYLELYLDIEKVRFGHRLSTLVSCDDAACSSLVPPMLLQPVVENAIKYGLYDTLDPITITIRGWREQGILYIEVNNPYDASLQQQPNKGIGFGLSSIRRRLYLLFARQDLLETAAANNIFTTLIKVPQPYDKSDHH
ncbi:Histidine kinase [Chitinophaga costaii]|uniref:Histidine kinase n=1 Tax=Chitinophaga costaii TaxID=1335309 RepID=A0A1C4DAL6_9BACT|nr:histidine kinase [Chitinophaga costaii]PUZ24538.1 sensor histidine kinase [Chitinophaga costaii]SCC28454.1 Histidine kinase [Chitinophaga costaii]